MSGDTDEKELENTIRDHVDDALHEFLKNVPE